MATDEIPKAIIPLDIISPVKSGSEDDNGSDTKVCAFKEKSGINNVLEWQITDKSEYKSSEESIKASGEIQWKGNNNSADSSDKTAKRTGNNSQMRKNYKTGEEHELVQCGKTISGDAKNTKDECPKRFLPSPPTYQKVPLRRKPSDLGIEPDEDRDKRMSMCPIIVSERRRSSSFTNRSDSPRELLQNKARDRLENGFQILKPKALISFGGPLGRPKVNLARRGSTGQIRVHEQVVNINGSKQSSRVLKSNHTQRADLHNTNPNTDNRGTSSTSLSQLPVPPDFARKWPKRLARRSSLPIESLCTNSATVSFKDTTSTKVCPKVTSRPETFGKLRRHSLPKETLNPTNEKDLQHMSASYLQPKMDKFNEESRKENPKAYALPPLEGAPSEIKNMDIPFPDSPALQPTPEKFLLPPIKGRSRSSSEVLLPFPLHRKFSHPDYPQEMVEASRRDQYAEIKQKDPLANAKSSPTGSPKGKVILPPLEGRRMQAWPSPSLDLSDKQHDKNQTPFALSPLEGKVCLNHSMELSNFELSCQASASAFEAKPNKRMSRKEYARSRPSSPVRNLSHAACKSRQHFRHMTSPPTPEYFSKSQKFIFPTERQFETASMEEVKERLFSREEFPLVASESKEKRRSRKGSKSNSPQTPPNKILLPPIQGRCSPRASRCSSPTNHPQQTHSPSLKTGRKDACGNPRDMTSPPTVESIAKPETISLERKPETMSMEDLKDRQFSRQESPLVGIESKEKRRSRKGSKSNSPQTPPNKILLPPIEGRCSPRNSRPSSPTNDPQQIGRKGTYGHRTYMTSPPAVEHAAKTETFIFPLERKPETVSMEDSKNRRFSRHDSPLAANDSWEKVRRPRDGSRNNSPKTPSSKVILPPIEDIHSPRPSRPSSPVNETQRTHIPRPPSSMKPERARKLSRSTSPVNGAYNLSRTTSPVNEAHTCRAHNLSRTTSPVNEAHTCRAHNLSRTTSPVNEAHTCRAHNLSRTTSPVNEAHTCRAHNLSRSTSPVNEAHTCRAHNLSRTTSPVNEAHTCRAHNLSRSTSPVNEAHTCRAHNLSRTTSPVNEAHTCRAHNLSRTTSPVNEPHTCRAHNLSRATSPVKQTLTTRNLSRSNSPVREPVRGRLSPKIGKGENTKLRSPPTPDHVFRKASFVFPVQNNGPISSTDIKGFTREDLQCHASKSRIRSNSNSPQTPNKIILPPIRDSISPRNVISSPMKDSTTTPKTTEGKDGKRSPKRRKKRAFPKLKRLLLPLDTGKAMQTDLSPEPQTPGCGARFMNFPFPPKKEIQSSSSDNLMAENPHVIVITPPCTPGGVQPGSSFILPENNCNFSTGESAPIPPVHSSSSVPSNIDCKMEPPLQRKSPTENGSGHPCSPSLSPHQHYFVPSPPKSPKSSRRRTSLVIRGRADSPKIDRSSPGTPGFLRPNLPTISREGVEMSCNQHYSAEGTRTPRMRSPRRNLSVGSKSDDEYPSNQSFTPPSPALGPTSFNFNIPSPAGSVDSEIEALLCNARRKIENLVNNHSLSPSVNASSRCSSADYNYLSNVFLTPSPGRSPVFELEEADKKYSNCHFRSLSMEEKLGGDEDNEETTKGTTEDGQARDDLRNDTTRSKSPCIKWKERICQQDPKESGEKHYQSDGNLTDANDRLSPSSCLERRVSNQQKN